MNPYLARKIKISEENMKLINNGTSINFSPHVVLINTKSFMSIIDREYFYDRQNFMTENFIITNKILSCHELIINFYKNFINHLNNSRYPQTSFKVFNKNDDIIINALLTRHDTNKFQEIELFYESDRCVADIVKNSIKKNNETNNEDNLYLYNQNIIIIKSEENLKLILKEIFENKDIIERYILDEIKFDIDIKTYRSSLQSDYKRRRKPLKYSDLMKTIEDVDFKEVFFKVLNEKETKEFLIKKGFS